MKVSRAAGVPRWDGLDAQEIAARITAPRVDLHAEVSSTQDVAHRLAEEGAAAGTVVLADAQRFGRGRHGRTWVSPPGQGVWCTIVERPSDARALEVLSLRVGIELAERLDAMAGERVMLKWPNDLRIATGKLAGILVEARWSGPAPAWVAIGVGVNVRPPGVADAAGLPSGTARMQVLRAVVDAVRAARDATGPLGPGELDRFRARDALVNRRIASPAVGIVQGIVASGALLVKTEQGIETHRAGTILLVEEP